MANELIQNPGNTGLATSNPEANVAQANGSIPQSAVDNTQPSASQQRNQINPITIPLQIQPQIATQGTVSNTNPMFGSNNANLSQLQIQSTENTQPAYGTNSNASNINSNVNTIDFNKIYNSYNKATGNNQNSTNTNSGIKKTSLGTTIVTPTNTNINTVKGQYQSEYSNTINSVISEILTQVTNGFNYDPNSDNALKLASEYASNTTMQSLAGSGVLNSSATSERVARIVSELIPVYEEKAHNRWLEGIQQLSNTAQLVMNYDDQQFNYWKEAKDREWQQKQFNYQKQQDALKNAWQRVDELGYVDNEASKILGVKVGTLSKDARLAKEQREHELKKMREQAELERKNEIAIAKIKSELNKKEMDYQSKLNIKETNNKIKQQTKADKELIKAQTNANIKETNNKIKQQTKADKEVIKAQSSANKSETANKYRLEAKYNTSNSSKSSNTKYTSQSTYEGIIKNRWLTKDFDGSYVVKENKNDELFNYVAEELNAGRMSETTALNLYDKYSITDPTVNTQTKTNNATTSKIKSGLTSDNISIWVKALDGNNKALENLGVTIFGQKKSNVKNSDAKKAVSEALIQIKNGKYTFTSNQQLINDLKNGKFGKLRWGL